MLFRSLISALSPYGILARGYAIVEGGDGRSVRSWRSAPKGAMIQVRLAEGRLAATVVESSPGQRRGRGR